MAMSTASPASQLDEPTIQFWGSQTGSKGVTPLAYTGSPFKLFIADVKSFFKYIRFLPFIMLPLSPCPSTHLDELYPSLKNLWCMLLHFILCVMQTGFLISIPFWFIVPVWMVVSFVTLFLVSNELFCIPLNGSKAIYESNPSLIEGFPERPNEQWLFLNGVAVGRHWLQSNIDRLSITFGRPVIGVHNRTSGIIFDVIQCLIQRNFTFATTDVRDCYAIVKKTLFSPCTKVVLILHSQGGIEGGMIIDWLLQEVPQELLSKLEVYTFGCAANHFNNPHRHVSWKSLRDSIPGAPSSNGRVPHSLNTRLPTGRSPDNPKEESIRHIEHYANNSDFVARWGVLSCTCAYNSSYSAPRFMGRVFERPGSGHQLNQHYLDNMFPLDTSLKRCSEESPFMELPIVIGNNVDIQDDAREGLEESYNAADGARWNENAIVRDVDNAITPVTISWPQSAVDTERTPQRLRVKHLSRLWLYRNGRCPPEEGMSARTDGQVNRMSTF